MKLTHKDIVSKLRQKIQAGIDGNGCAEMYLRWWPRKGLPTIEQAKAGTRDEYDYTAKDVDEAFAAFDDTALMKITELDLKYRRLQKLPGTVRGLRNLETLVLCDTGIIRLPDWLPELIHLKNLIVHDVWSKRGAKIADGLAPLVRMPWLEELYWSDDWTGFLDVPDIIGKCTQLKRLGFSGTTMTKFPPWLRNLRLLKSFSYGGFGIRNIPAWFCTLTSLERLWLNDTAIHKLPDIIGNLTALKELYLFSNPIAELPESLINLINLKKLVVSGYSTDYNSDLKKLPEGMENLTALEELVLEGTNIEKIPEPLLDRERKGLLKITYKKKFMRNAKAGGVL